MVRRVVLLAFASCLGSRGAEGRCQGDGDCAGGEVCTRIAACFPASQVRDVHVTWTLRGAEASAAACSRSPDLDIEFRGAGGPEDRLAYSPVPCIAGKFSIDKLPVSYSSVRLGRDGLGWQIGSLDAAGDAALDLPF
jgi:hypothetical protein